MNNLQNVSTNIPLHCNVCPKKPDFSDVSHLLTHISSKGHLSNYYKMKVKASQDGEARKIIDDYDEWYEDWNLQDMMQERMSQKDKKRGSGSGNASRRTSASTSARSTPVPSNSHRRQPRMRDSIQHVDPALNNHNRHRQSQLSRSVTPSNGYALDSFYSRVNGFAPPLHNWAPDASLFNSPIKQESLDSDYSDDDAFDPLPHRAPPRRTGHRQRDSLPSILDDFENEIASNDNSKLKGIVWPGMSIFDSATAEMQRKRNQKKHGSVLIQLQATSEDTEPVEFVFRDGNLEKQRTITGNPESSDSLIEGESSPEPEVPEKKRARRKAPRPALAEKDTNSGRVLRKRGDSHHPPFSRKRSPYYDVVKIEDDDDDITYDKPRPRNRVGLSIHRDNSGPEITFNNPAQMNYLTTGFQSTGRQNATHRQALAPLDYNANALQSDGRRPRNQFRQSDVWGQLNSGFRPSAHMPNPSNSNINFASFGQLMNQGLTTSNNISLQNHHGPLQYQQHQYANYVHPQPQPMPQNENTMFSQPHQQNVTAWDNNMFGFSNADMSLLAGSDLNFTVNTTEAAAPVFFKEDGEVTFKEDDEVTLSAENSEN